MAASSGFTAQLMSEVKLPGITARIADYSWKAGSEISLYAPSLVLRRRLSPLKIKARGWTQSGSCTDLGSLTMRRACDEMRITASEEDEQTRVIACHFDPCWLHDTVGVENYNRILEADTCFDLRNSDIDAAMRRIAREIAEPGLGCNTLIESLGMSIAVDLSRLAGAKRMTLPPGEKGLSTVRLQQIRDYIEASYERSPTISEIALECGLSSAHLRRLFKNSTGKTLHEFVIAMRIQRAQELLLDTHTSLKVISYRLGFSHPSAFSAVFRKVTGEGPREFRTRCASKPVCPD